MLADIDRPIANPLVVFRDDFDDCAVLFDPDTGNSFGLNPVGTLIWKKLDGKHTVEDIVLELRNSCDEVPAEAREHVAQLINELIEKGLAGVES